MAEPARGAGGSSSTPSSREEKRVKDASATATEDVMSRSLTSYTKEWGWGGTCNTKMSHTSPGPCSPPSGPTTRHFRFSISVRRADRRVGSPQPVFSEECFLHSHTHLNVLIVGPRQRHPPPAAPLPLPPPAQLRRWPQPEI